MLKGVLMQICNDSNYACHCHLLLSDLKKLKENEES